MSVDFHKARELCTAQELALVTSARAQDLRLLTSKRLDTKIKRARGLRDKFRDLALRQAREAHGKAALRKKRPASRNVRTVEKAKLFGEVLRRFEARAAKLDQGDASEPIPGGERATAPERSHRASAQRSARTTRSALAARPNRQQRRKVAAADTARKRVKFAASQGPRVHAHVSSRNRRHQARRDAR
ncbi:MAG TPA: hypothetical protein VN894_14155 [Polyangiaceae bacterium]|nr:hypothetical protein [Polyangiaceae bacterium]